MLTFLPFSRAVKACPRSIAVCGLMLYASCVSRGPAHTAPGPATGPLGAPDTVPTSELAETSPADTERVEPSSADAAPAPGAADMSAPEVVVEEPYPLDARPRSPSPMQAAAEDEELARWNIGGSADPSYPSSQASYHPGTRVVVDTRLAKRRNGALASIPPSHGLTAERVQAQARSHGYWPFRLCFESGQRQKKGSGGETRVAFMIGLRGKVKHAWLLDSKLDNPKTAACLVREAGKLEFAPAPPRALSMVASIRIWPGDAELPALPEGPSAVATGGAFDPNSVRGCVATKQAQISACFANARRADPSLWGRLALAAILEVDGTVHRISEVESHFPNAAATRCVQTLIAGIIFPSVNGKPFTLVLPLRLSPPLSAGRPVAQAGQDASPSQPQLDKDGGSKRLSAAGATAATRAGRRRRAARRGASRSGAPARRGAAGRRATRRRAARGSSTGLRRAASTAFTS